MNLYSHKDWLRFRREVIRLDGERCVRCDRSPSDDVVLQVHHKAYAHGRLPWEYGHNECETLCKGCHAEGHGKIMPQSGWTLLCSDDLGDLSGECELCGTALRYSFAIIHPAWGSMAVGTDCCDRLTGSTEASEYHDRYLKARDKRKRFVGSKRWKELAFGLLRITQEGLNIDIFAKAGKYRLKIDGVAGKKDYDTIIDAKLRVFEFIETGEADRFFEKRRKEQQQRRAARRYRPALHSGHLR